LKKEDKVDTGILGGTFDPIHLGHLVIAREAKHRLNLSKVIFVPSGQPWLKSDREITSPGHRVKMIELAISGIAYYEISTVEIDRPGPSYTVDTLVDLRQKLGKAMGLFWILGWDSLNELPRWHNPAEVVKMCRLAVFPRPGSEPPDLDALMEYVPGIKESTVLLNIKPRDISSTDIRGRVARGLSLEGLVTDSVARYIREQKLYL
jgi:nicotinate-nucleotide adenylyltransferase